MTLTAPDVQWDAAAATGRQSTTPWLAAAACASLGAGAVHFAAAGAHGEHRPAVVAFTVLAVAQVVWGGSALARRGPLMGWAGALLGLVALGGWAVSKLIGLPLVAGLDTAEPVQLADTCAALLAAAALLLASRGLWSGHSARGAMVLRVPGWLVVVGVTALAVPGVVTASGHLHANGATTVAGTHGHEGPQPVAVPYDPALPIDLGGTPGVSPRQQAAAENLVSLTLARLPQWADSAVAERAGFRTIGDGFTGTEHLVNRAFLTDRTTLDPDRPESLVYDTSGGGRRLVAAMFMLAPGTPLADVPDVGGALVQWHIHDNLCYSPSGYVQGVADASGACPPGQVKPTPAPMVHVWITKHPCGPFAALEGIAGGSIAAGQSRLCDHAHGSKA